MTPEVDKKIEEAAKSLYPSLTYNDEYYCDVPLDYEQPAFTAGVKSDTAKDYWQKGMYTEEEVLSLLKRVGKEITYPETYYEPSDTDENNDKYFNSEVEDWFKQNKKK